MKKILLLFFAVLFSFQLINAQETYFQTGHTNDILEVHFSPDDSQLVSYSAGDGRFILWEVKSGRQVWTRKTSFIRKANESINLKEFYWSKDGKTIITKSNNGTYQTWDAQTGKVLALSETKPEIELIAPNKKNVSFTKDDFTMKIVDGETKETKEIKRFGYNPRFEFSNDGEMIAEGGGWGDASIKITEIKTGKFWWLDGHPSVISGIGFSPDGKFLAVGGSDKIIYILDVAKKSIARKFDGNSKPIKSISFSLDGKFLIALDKDGEMSVRELQSGNILRGAESTRGISGLNSNEFSKDGKYFLYTNDGDFGVWQTSDWKRMSGFKTPEKYESKHGIMSIGYDRVPVYAATFINDGKEIIASHYDGTWRVWNINSGKQIKKFKIGEDVEFLAALENQKIIAVVHGSDRNNDEMKIKLFDSENGTVIKQFDDEETGYIESFALSSNGKNFVTSDIGGNVLLWDINKPKPIREFRIGFSGDDAIAFSPDGKTFAVGGRNQNLFLFDVETGEKLWQLISSYQLSELEIQLEERGKKARDEVEARKAARDKQAEAEVSTLSKKITLKFSHYGDAESFWDQRIAESGAANKSKLKLPKEKASVAWFTLTNDADLPVSIDTNSMYFNPKCRGLCDGAEISSRYVLELKSGETNVNGYDSYSKTILPPKTTVYFSVSLEHFIVSKAIYLGFTFQKDNADDERSNDYGTEQKLYLREANLPE